MEYGDSRLPTRFWLRVYIEPMSGCWLWIGNVDQHGYGKFWYNGKTVRPHRLICELNLGVPDDDKIVTRHLCDIKLCCNPWHIQFGTQAENIRDMHERGRAKGAPYVHSRKTHCARGHEYNGANTIRTKLQRVCRICKQENQARYLERKSRNK